MIAIRNECENNFGLMIDREKTKIMAMGSDENIDIKLDTERLESVDRFVYLGSMIAADNDCSVEIKRRIALAHASFVSLDNIWKSGNISIKTKLKILNACVFSTLLYACETWTLKKVDIQRLEGFEMKCYRKILKIRWNERVRNEKIRRDLHRVKTIGNIVKERKLGLFGHICRMGDERLIKLIMLRSRDWKRKRGRPRRLWMYNTSIRRCEAASSVDGSE